MNDDSTVNTAPPPFGGIDEDVWEAWKENPCTKLVLAEIYKAQQEHGDQIIQEAGRHEPRQMISARLSGALGVLESIRGILTVTK
jgi:hypothetical protein